MSTENDDQVIEAEEPTNGKVSDVDSLLRGVRELRQEKLSADHFLDLDVPGYNGLIVARYRPYNINRSEKRSLSMRKRMERGDPVLLDSACDTLIDACDEIFFRKDGKLIKPDEGATIRYDQQLADLLEITNAPSARDVVKSVFFTDQSLINQSIAVEEWLKNAFQEVDDDLVGESVGSQL
jgi:hypothetical protein